MKTAEQWAGIATARLPYVWDNNQAINATIAMVIQQAMQSQHEASFRAGVEAAANIADGNYDRPVAEKYAKDGKPHKGDKCPHGYYTWEPCESCVADAIRAIPTPPLTKDSK